MNIPDQIFVSGSTRGGLGKYLATALSGTLMSRAEGRSLDSPDSYLTDINCDHVFVNCAIDYNNPESQLGLAQAWIEKFKSSQSVLINIGSTAVHFADFLPGEWKAYADAKKRLENLSIRPFTEPINALILTLNIGRLPPDGIEYDTIESMLRLQLASASTRSIIYTLSCHYDRNQNR